MVGKITLKHGIDLEENLCIICLWYCHVRHECMLEELLYIVRIIFRDMYIEGHACNYMNFNAVKTYFTTQLCINIYRYLT